MSTTTHESGHSRGAAMAATPSSVTGDLRASNETASRSCMVLPERLDPSFATAGTVISATLMGGAHFAVRASANGLDVALHPDAFLGPTIFLIVFLPIFGLGIGLPILWILNRLEPGRKLVGLFAGLTLFVTLGGILASAPVLEIEAWSLGAGVSLVLAFSSILIGWVLQRVARVR